MKYSTQVRKTAKKILAFVNANIDAPGGMQISLIYC